MRTDTAFVLTVLVLCYAVVSGLVKRWYIAPALIFVAFGMALGPFGFGVIDIGAHATSFTVLALAVNASFDVATFDESALYLQAKFRLDEHFPIVWGPTLALGFRVDAL